MTAPVVRDVDIVTQARVTASTPTLVETATTLSGQPLTALNGATTGNLPAAVAAAGANSTVVLSGTFNTTATTTLQTGQTLMGAGTLTVRTASGRTATLVAPGGTIAAAGPVSAVVVVSDSVLTGLTISNTFVAGSIVTGVSIQGAGNATISGNVITATGAPQTTGILMDGGSNTVIANNTITATSAVTAIGIIVRPLGTTASFRLSDNALGGSTANVSLQNFAGHINILPGSVGNTVLSGNCVGTVDAGTIGFTNAANCP